MIKYFVFALVFVVSNNCNAQFAKGADIGWLDQMEASGYKFFNDKGIETNCLDILKEKGINAIRLRVWVNPSNDKFSGHCSKKEVTQMALRAKKLGMKIMIDFHYSDSWADPQKQIIPAAWLQHSYKEILDDVYKHTYEVLDTLKKVGATPDWVQVGNEITWGMMWPIGNVKNWPYLSQLLNKGYDAVKAVNANIKVIIHIDEGNNAKRYRTFFDSVTKYKVRYDIIGASYYPYWVNKTYEETINDLANNLNDVAKHYNKEVMVVEVGGVDTAVQNTYNMLIAVMKKVKAIPDNKGLGVFYWEPQGARYWSHYALSCWGNDGKPTKALDAFLFNP